MFHPVPLFLITLFLVVTLLLRDFWSRGIRTKSGEEDDASGARRVVEQREFDEIVERHNRFFKSDEENTREKIDELVADLSNLDLRKVSLKGEFLEHASLQEADLRGCNMVGAEFKGSDFMYADLRGANLTGANFADANMHGVKFDRDVRCRSIRVASSYGSPRFKRFAEHQDYIEEMRSKPSNKFMYYLWLISSDCGRSFWLWVMWSAIFMLGFGGIFYAIGPDSFHIQDKLSANSNEYFALTYYSVITFTTLGFGDVTPSTTSAAVAVIVEVIIGYMMLGGLISIFANKIVER